MPRWLRMLAVGLCPGHSLMAGAGSTGAADQRSVPITYIYERLQTVVGSRCVTRWWPTPLTRDRQAGRVRERSEVFSLPSSHRVLTVFSPCSHRVLAVFSPCSRRVLTVFSPCSHRVLTVFSPCSHRILTVFSPCSHRVLTVFSPCSRRAHTAKTRREHGENTVRTR